MIRVTGGSASQKKYITSVVEFCQKKLMPRMNNLEITVRLKDLTKTDCYGFCTADPDGEAERLDRPRAFDIELNCKKMPLRKLLVTLCHEMVHVKQYAQGELYESARQCKMRWQGNWMKDNIDYWDQPWEIEAAGREDGLFIRWVQAEGLAKKKWVKET
jgi:hypothetical protein